MRHFPGTMFCYPRTGQRYIVNKNCLPVSRT